MCQVDKKPDELYKTFFSYEFFSAEVLTSNERRLIPGWSDKRIKDFSTGRYCARKVLSELNIEETDILQGPDKEPLWPIGLVGSISHSKNMVGAIAAKSDSLKSVGLDIETIGRIEKGLWELLFSPAEQLFLKQCKDDDIDFYSTLLFSAKECFYKLQFPLTKPFWILQM